MNNKFIFKSITAGLILGLVFTSGFIIARSFDAKYPSSNSEIDNRFDISSLNGIAIDQAGAVNGTNYFYDDAGVTNDTLRISLDSYFTTVRSMPNTINELIISNLNTLTHSFVISCVNNSKTFKDGKTATINYLTQTKLSLSGIVGDYFACEVNKYDDDSLTKNEILSSLKSNFTTLNINQLEVINIDNSQKTATIQPIANSTIYSPSAVVINVGFTLVTKSYLTYDNPTLSNVAPLSSTPSFYFNGSKITIDTTNKFT
jgi:hypothetical protein